VLATTVGETFADFLSGLGLGLGGTTVVMTVVFLVVLAVQFRARRYVPAVYWLTVVLISVVGTLVTDNLTDALGVSLVVSTVVFAVALAGTFIAWYAKEGTLSIHSIVTRRRETYYWITVLATFALGTAAGDLTAISLKLGYSASAVLFAAVISVPALLWWRVGLNEVAAFWAAYVVTRPLGASVADWLGKQRSASGLGLGDGTVTVVSAVVIVLLVAWVAVRRSDIQRPFADQVPAGDAAHTGVNPSRTADPLPVGNGARSDES
jgi:uncharacterized membrane-anchored protein